MPLFNSDWEKGKCGFKLLQYFAMEIPAVASDVGVNCKIIDEGKNGFLIGGNDTETWINKLTLLLNDCNLRKEMGSAGRIKIEKYFSVNANKNKVMGLFE